MMRRTSFAFLITLIASLSALCRQAERSVARGWNEVVLEAIRNDFARPTVHARNLFHISAAMYDAWAVYDEVAEPFFLGRSHRGFFIPFAGIETPADKQAAQEEAISYAVYRLINYRFANSPGVERIRLEANSYMLTLGHDPANRSTDYSTGSPAALGNYIAERVIAFGQQDGSNEADQYANLYYAPTNYQALDPTKPGNPSLIDPNRWQPLSLGSFIDQAGNPIPGNIIPFLSPEWGSVVPFSLKSGDLKIKERDGQDYWVYHDPGDPSYFDPDDQSQTDEYVWSFSLVSTWSSHLDPSDGVMWDISPASLGNIPFSKLPKSAEGHPDFYDLLEGGDISTGYDVNPVTGRPYTPQLVPRGDYARVLAEFWADGPDSETPPGHWFVILNYINDHPLLEKRFRGQGEVLDDLEWDIKAYFMLGGAMHDVAISAWGIKGYYDYIRPISAIRWIAGLGQSSDPQLPHYHPGGFKLIDGFIQLVKAGDPLAGPNGENVNKIKIKAWRGHLYVGDPALDEAGVGWILAENWWPYQRPSFVTPPFAGYVSGHSTYSRAAAELLTLLTGSEYFPGGMGEFNATKNQFLVFEEGPSTDLVLQWAKYADASDQCSLSRIWGGIHPPMDDIPGRIIGHDIGIEAFEYALGFFDGVKTGIAPEAEKSIAVFPNPVPKGESLKVRAVATIQHGELRLTRLDGTVVGTWPVQLAKGAAAELAIPAVRPGVYLLQLSTKTSAWTERVIIE